MCDGQAVAVRGYSSPLLRHFTYTLPSNVHAPRQHVLRWYMNQCLEVCRSA